MPTSRPRYQITDTGPVRDMLDQAEKRWPDVRDRKALLLQLVAAGAAHASAEAADHQAEAAERRARQIEAHRRSVARLDTEYLLSDEAWR